MPDFLQNLRMRNLFGVDNPIGNDLPSQGGISGNLSRNPMGMSGGVNPYSNLFTQPNAPPNQFQTTSEVGPNLDIASKMKELYTPETENSDRLNALLSSYPQHEKASMLRKIGTAIIGGLAGPKAGNNFLNAPFNEKLEDWKNKVGPTERAANLERQTNVNERTMAYQTIASQLRQQAQDAKDKNDAVNAKIRQQRADVYQMKSANPNMKFDFSGPFVLVADPATGKITKTAIDTGNLTDADKLALGHQYRTEEIAQRGDITSDQITQRGDIESGHIAERGAQARTTKATPSGSKTGKEELPTQTRVRQFNAARELANTRADLKKFIKIGSPGSNDFTITPPSEGMFGHSGPTTEQYAEIQKAIYGMAEPKMGRSSNTITPTTGTRVTIYKDGKAVGTIPAEQVEQAKKQGYTLK